MSASETRANQAAISATGRPSVAAVAGSIPTSHEPLHLDSLAAFSSCLTADLELLEAKFAAFTTRSSYKTSSKR